MAQLAKTFFAMNMTKLPTEWRDMGNQFPDAFQLSERMAAPNPPPPVSLFMQATLNKYHVDTAKTISDGFSKYICIVECGYRIGTSCEVRHWARSAGHTSDIWFFRE